MPPRDYVHYIVMDKDYDLFDSLTKILGDNLVTGELPVLVQADIVYANRPKQIYRLTHTAREIRGREKVPVGQRGRWRKPKPKPKPKADTDE